MQAARRTRLLDALLTVLVAGVACTWALLTPPFQAPDEPQHLNSVIRLAHGGGWPAPGEATMSLAVREARQEVAYGTDVPGRFADRADRDQLVDATPTPAAERVRVDAATSRPYGAPTDPADIDQMTQHPPLYYLLGAGVLHALGLSDARWDLQLLALRLFDVLLLLPVVPLASWAVRRLTGSVAAGLLAGTFTLFVPQVGHVLGALNNDALVTLVGTVVTALCVRVLVGDRSWRAALAVGAVIGVGLLTKVMAAFLLPVVALAYLLAPPMGARAATSLLARAGRVLVVGLTALAVGGWWWVRNLLVLGTVQPVGIDIRLSDLEPEGPVTYVATAWPRLARSFFGDLGWLDIRTPPVFWLTGTLALGVLAVVALTARGLRRSTVTLLALPTTLGVAVLVNGWGFYAAHGRLTGHQGRYLYAGLLALAVVVAVALWRLAGRGERRTATLVPFVTVAGLAVSAYGLVLGFTGFYRGPGETLDAAADRWAAFSPVAAPWLVAVPVLTGVVAVTTVLVAVLHALATRRDERTGPELERAVVPV
jgi:4-amino-4-deoxy-L-arabinose transferase-like glycosyltransferase